jgi:hypothetical protein
VVEAVETKNAIGSLLLLSVKSNRNDK